MYKNLSNNPQPKNKKPQQKRAPITAGGSRIE